MRVLLLSLLALLPLVSAWADIPYHNCGSPADHVKIASARATEWPPRANADTTLQLLGVLNEDLNGGTYNVKVSFFGFPIVDERGDMRDLPDVQWPVKAGEWNITSTFTLPAIIAAGTQVTLKLSAEDERGEGLTCIETEFNVPQMRGQRWEQTMPDGEYTLDLQTGIRREHYMGGLQQEESIYAPAVMPALDDSPSFSSEEAALWSRFGSVKFQMLPGHFKGLRSASARSSNSRNQEEFEVEYEDCAVGDNPVIIEGVRAGVWPPVAGVDTWLSVDLNVREEVQDGWLHQLAYLDGQILQDATASLSAIAPLPWQKGSLEMKGMMVLPDPFPFTGELVFVLAGSDRNGHQLFCAKMKANI